MTSVLAHSRRGRIARVACAALLTACNARQNMLDTASPQAARVERLWWLFFIVCSVVFVIVIALVLAAVLHKRAEGEAVIDQAREGRMARVVALGTAATVAILLVFLVASFVVGREINGDPSGSAMVIQVTGHQWWWEVEYVDSLPQRRITTANEIHIPVGQRVLLKTTSQDVIHSLWAPNLNGKRDLIPGHETGLWLQADRAGVFRGQCAEFCGLQHARMSLLVIAEPVPQFNQWLAQQREEARVPSDTVQQRGQQVFLTSACVMCHAIGGTPAGSHVGPDLTHLASRRTIAAGTLPNTKGYLAGWIVDAQSIKPGAKMPPNQIAASDLQALLAYLESLE